MDVPVDHTPNMQRLRYEAFSKFATEVNNCDDYDALTTLVVSHVKFIIDSFIFRVYFEFEQTQLAFTVSRGKSTIYNEFDDPIAEFEQRTLLRGIPLNLSRDMILSDRRLKNTSYNDPKIYTLSVLPTVNKAYSIVISNALRSENQWVEADFKFLKLISELIGSKLFQLSLLKELEAKGVELEQKNAQITGLNQTLEEKIVERTAALDQANQELEALFYSTTHDLRTPLTNIMGLANVAGVYTNDPNILALFDGCLSAVTSLDKLLRKLNSLSFEDTDDDCCELNFTAIIGNIKEKLLNEAPNKAMLINLSGNYDCCFVLSESMMSVILENIIENAFIFCEAQQVMLNIHFTQSANRLEIDFVDNGIGIVPEISGEVFNMFYRGSDLSTGSGLGLYIVKKLLAKLGGHARFESVTGEGTVFKIALPYRQVRD